jgi:hypothetical protein
VKLVVDSTKLLRGPSPNVIEVFNAGMLGASLFQELVTHVKSSQLYSEKPVKDSMKKQEKHSHHVIRVLYVDHLV